MNESHEVADHRPSLDDYRVPWSIVDAVYGVVLVAGVSVATLLVLRLLVGDRGPEESHPFVTFGLGLVQVVIFVVVWALAINRYRVRWRSVGFARSRTRRSLLLAVAVLFGSLGFAVLYGAVVMAADIDSLVPEPIPERALGEGVFRLANIGIIGLVGPLAEEVFFRGFLLAAMVRPLGAPRAMVISSAVFAVGHLSIGVLVPFFVTGWLLSWLYLRTRSIWPPFAAHAAQNLIAIGAISAMG